MSSLALPQTDAPSAAVPRVLAARQLACRRGDRILFSGLEFDVQPGQVVWLRGDNGKGKTSLLRLLAGLSTPEAGAITWGGRPIRAADSGYRQQLVYIGHANALKDDLTALESLQFIARLHGRDDRPETLTAALRALGVHAKRNAPVGTLSQGQRRRVALARLHLETGPSAWLLDEPFDALDVAGIAALNELITAHTQRGGSVVLTSHQALSLARPQPHEFQLGPFATTP